MDSKCDHKCLYKGETERCDMQKRKRPCDHKSRNLRDEATGQGMMDPPGNERDKKQITQEGNALPVAL